MLWRTRERYLRHYRIPIAVVLLGLLCCFIGCAAESEGHRVQRERTEAVEKVADALWNIARTLERAADDLHAIAESMETE